MLGDAHLTQANKYFVIKALFSEFHVVAQPTANMEG